MRTPTRTLLGLLVLLIGLVLLPGSGPAEPAPRTDLLGDPLPAGAQSRFGTLRLRHEPAVGCLALSPDGKLTASVNNTPEAKEQEDGDGVSVRVWETASGKLVAERLAPKTGKILAILFGKDGRLFILGRDPICTVWDFRKREAKILRKGKQEPAAAGAFSPDGKTLALGLESGRVLLLDPATGQEQAVLKPGKLQEAVTCLAFAADSGRLAVGHANGRTKLWNCATRKVLRTYAADAEDESEVRAICFAPDGRALALLGEERVRLMQSEANRRVAGFQRPPEPLAGVHFSPDGKQLVGVGTDGRVYRWDARTGKQQAVTDKKLFEEDTFDNLVVIDPAARLAAAALENTIVLIDLKTGQSLHEHIRHPPLLHARWVGPQLAACSGIDQVIRFWDSTTGKLVRTQATFEGMMDLALSDLSPDGKRLAGIAEDGLHVREGKKELWKADEAIGATATFLRFSPDGRSLAALYANGIVIRETATGKFQRTLSLKQKEQDNHHLGWSRDGRLLAVTSPELNEVAVWELATGRVRQRITITTPQLAAFSSDGRHLITSSIDGKVRVLELGVEKPCLERNVGEEGGSVLAVSPDGTRLASNAGLAIHVWDMAGKELAVFRGHDGAVLDLKFSPDGRFLLSSSEDGTAVVWDVPLSDVRARTTPVQWKGDGWKQLADEDPAQAFLAMRALRQRPAEALALFSARLTPAGRVDVRRVERLLADLDSDEFQTREKAEAELRSLDASIETTLRAVLQNPPSVEVQRAVERLLEGIEGSVTRPERMREQRAVEVLETLGTPEARLLLEKLARGGTSGLTSAAREALERLAK